MQAHREYPTPPSSGKIRVCLTVLGVAAAVFAVVTLVVRTCQLSNIVALVVAVGSPYTAFAAMVGFALSVLSRRIVLSIITVLVVTANLAVQVPWYYFGRTIEVGPYVDVRVLSSNLRKGQADASSFVGLAEDRADVLTVSELTPEELDRFLQAGIEKLFPYSVVFPAPGAGGVGLWSRYPLIAVSPPNQRQAAAQLRVPGVQLEPFVASVHITSPLAHERNSFSNWRDGISATKVRLSDFAESAGFRAMIVAGDFNSTPDMRQFRDLLTDGYRDAVEQTGAGFAPTFPSNTWFPPLITIDHVLTRNAGVSSIHTVELPGSDHRALLATVRIPLDPTAS
jgi:endonuclease/exonuclease/phosphatase (EEP) superfamily protein YafD